MTKETTGLRKRSRTAAALLGVVGLVLMSAGLSLVVEGSASAAPAKVHKSYVCKYVSKPGVAERLQTGQNPIWVSNSSLGASGLVSVGEVFKDGQIKSVVIVANTPKLSPEPSVAACPGVVTPDVLFNDSVCLNGSATNPSFVGSNTADITYTITSGSVANGSTVTITAIPKAGFAFLPSANNVFTHTFGPVATGCGEVTPTNVTPGVTFHDSVCSQGVATAPFFTGANTADIVYTVTSGAVSNGSAVTVTASPKSGFAFAQSTQTAFSHTFAAAPTNCGGAHGTAVATTAAQFMNPTCADGNSVSAKLDGSGFLSAAQWEAKGNFIDTGKVTYTITGSFAPGGSVNVAASADKGFVLTPASVSQWSHTFGTTVSCAHAQHVTIPAVVHSGLDSVGTTPVGTNSALSSWGYSLAGAGAAFFLTALVMGRRRQSVS